MEPDTFNNTLSILTLSQLANTTTEIDGTLAFCHEDKSAYVWNGTDWIKITKPESQEPTKVLREFVREELTFAERDQMMCDYEEFEQRGSIGDCTLREIVDRWKSRLGGPPVADFFGPARDIMFEVYRAQAEMVIEQTS